MQDLGCRFYDPQIGRFTTQDPVAAFMPGISPYAYAYDNPISFNDPDGLSPDENQDHPGKKRHKSPAQRRAAWRNNPIRLFFVHLFGGQTNSVGRVIPNSKNGPGSWSPEKGGSSSTSSSDNPPPTNNPISPSNPESPSEPSVANNGNPTPTPTPTNTQPDIPEPSFPIPDAGEKASFSEDIYFVSSSDKLYDIPENGQFLNKLVKTLQDYPNVTLFIYGNVQIDGGTPGNSVNALGQQVRYNYQWRTAGELMTGRAKAVYEYLVRKGIAPQRLNYGAGNVFTNTKRNMKKTSFQVSNP